MFHLSGSEILLYGGIAVMTVAVMLAVLCAAVFLSTWRKLKAKLEKEYGKLKYY